MAKIMCADPLEVVKEALWLAYKASVPAGLGFLQARDDVTKDMLWQSLTAGGDQNRPRKVYTDYVFGRMMKTVMEWDDTGVIVSDAKPRYDYQSWCHQYTTFAGLVEAAIESLEKSKKS